MRRTVRAAFLAALGAHDEVPRRHFDHHGTDIAVLEDPGRFRFRGLRRKTGERQQYCRNQA